jgi:hypothetical protein
VSTSSEPQPDRSESWRSDRRPSSDLDVLAVDPSLAALAWHGWQLDGLPTTSVAWAFAGAMITTWLSFGAFATAPVIVAMLIGLLLTGSASLMRDVAAARATLRVTRVGLIAWALISAMLMHVPALAG